jgi:hypothetical protein
MADCGTRIAGRTRMEGRTAVSSLNGFFPRITQMDAKNEPMEGYWTWASLSSVKRTAAGVSVSNLSAVGASRL